MILAIFTLYYHLSYLMEFIYTNVSRLVVLYAILLDRIGSIRNPITNAMEFSYIRIGCLYQFVYSKTVYSLSE